MNNNLLIYEEFLFEKENFCSNPVHVNFDAELHVGNIACTGHYAKNGLGLSE